MHQVWQDAVSGVVSVVNGLESEGKPEAPTAALISDATASRRSSVQSEKKTCVFIALRVDQRAGAAIRIFENGADAFKFAAELGP